MNATHLLATIFGVIACALPMAIELWRAYIGRPVVDSACTELIDAMRSSEVTVEYSAGIYQVYSEGAWNIRYFDAVRTRLLIECGYTVLCFTNARESETEAYAIAA